MTNTPPAIAILKISEAPLLMLPLFIQLLPKYDTRMKYASTQSESFTVRSYSTVHPHQFPFKSPSAEYHTIYVYELCSSPSPGPLVQPSECGVARAMTLRSVRQAGTSGPVTREPRLVSISPYCKISWPGAGVHISSAQPLPSHPHLCPRPPPSPPMTLALILPPPLSSVSLSLTEHLPLSLPLLPIPSSVLPHLAPILHSHSSPLPNPTRPTYPPTC